MISARWKGLDEAIRNVRALGEELANREVLEPALVKTGEPLRDEIIRTAPRSQDAEHMADTFVSVASREDRAEGRAVALVGPAAGYPGFVAPFVEFGTSKMGARPFIRPALDAFDFVATFVPHLRTRFERVVRKYAKRAGK